MSDQQPGTSLVPYATPGALERVETRVRDDRITLQKQLEREVVTLRSEMTKEIESLRELYDQRFALKEKALELQAREYERRLDVLNHAHEQEKERVAQTVLRETFDDYKDSMATALEIARKEHQAWKDDVNRSITASQTSAKVWMAAIGLLVTIISLAIRFVGN